MTLSGRLSKSLLDNGDFDIILFVNITPETLKDFIQNKVNKNVEKEVSLDTLDTPGEASLDFKDLK